MHVISRKRLREFWEKNPEAKADLEDWYRTANKAHWLNLTQVRQTYRHADAVGTCTVFNIRQNRYRLITKIEYRIQRIYIKSVLTHAEYDREEWKRGCTGQKTQSP